MYRVLSFVRHETVLVLRNS